MTVPAYKIETDPRNKEAVERLIKQVEVPRGVLPFVGAGLSFPFGFPLWGDFLLDQARQAKVLRKVKLDLQASQYEEAAEHIARAIGPNRFDRIVRETFSRGAPGPRMVGTAAAVLPRLAVGPVITTNFDHVLEQVFREAGYSFNLALWGSRTRLAADTLAEDYRLLLKLHGDADDAEDRVLTKAEYERHYGGLTRDEIDPTLPLPSLMLRLFSSRPVLFLGCSLQSDRYLDLLANAFADSPEHFAVVEEEESSGRQTDRESSLRAHGITPLWFPKGGYGLIPVFLEFLALHTRAPNSQAPTLPVSIVPATGSRYRPQPQDRAQRERFRREWLHLSSDEQRLRFVDENGLSLYQKGFWGDYVEYATLAIQAAHRLRDQLKEAELLNNLHLAYKRMGKAEDAQTALSAAREVLGGLPLDKLHAVVVHNTALAEFDAERYPEAAVLYREALRLARRTGDDRLEPIWRNLGLALARAGDRRKGLGYVRRALARSREKDDAEWEFRALLALSDIHDRAGDSRRMAEVLYQALLLTRDIQGRAQVLDYLGVALYHQGKFNEALRCYLDALGYEQASDEPRALVSTLLNIAWLHFDAVEALDIGAKQDEQDQEEVQMAALYRSGEYYEQALAHARALGDPVLRAHVLIQKSLVTSLLGTSERGLAELAEAVPILRRVDRFGDLATALNNRGRILEEWKGEPGASLRSYRAALRYARRAKDLGLERTILFNLARTLQNRGRLHDACAAAQELSQLEAGKRDRYSSRHRKLLAELKNRCRPVHLSQV